MLVVWWMNILLCVVYLVVGGVLLAQVRAEFPPCRLDWRSYYAIASEWVRRDGGAALLAGCFLLHLLSTLGA